MSDKIIVYYSRADENYVNGQLRMLSKGNTEIAAKRIQQLTSADMFRIEQAEPYAKGYNECIEQARSDQNKNARPKLKGYPESLDGYSTIYLGFPNYWGTMPMAVFTFLEHFDLGGKTIKSLSARTRAAAWETAFRISAGYAPTQRSGNVLRFTEAMPTNHQRK